MQKGLRSLPANIIFDDRFREAAEKLGLRGKAAESEFAKFKDYWLAQPGQKGVKANWLACWRTWCRRSGEWQKWPNGIGRARDERPPVESGDD